jgi:hypothetical protein
VFKGFDPAASWTKHPARTQTRATSIPGPVTSTIDSGDLNNDAVEQAVELLMMLRVLPQLPRDRAAGLHASEWSRLHSKSESAQYLGDLGELLSGDDHVTIKSALMSLLRVGESGFNLLTGNGAHQPVVVTDDGVARLFEHALHFSLYSKNSNLAQTQAKAHISSVLFLANCVLGPSRPCDNGEGHPFMRGVLRISSFSKLLQQQQGMPALIGVCGGSLDLDVDTRFFDKVDRPVGYGLRPKIPDDSEITWSWRRTMFGEDLMVQELGEPGSMLSMYKRLCQTGDIVWCSDLGGLWKEPESWARFAECLPGGLFGFDAAGESADKGTFDPDNGGTTDTTNAIVPVVHPDLKSAFRLPGHQVTNTLTPSWAGQPVSATSSSTQRRTSNSSSSCHRCRTRR